jgi:S1-C subfamily serine protease
MRANELFDAYLNDTLSAAERAQFESDLRMNDTLKNAFEEHRKLISVLGVHTERTELKKKLSKIHQQEFGNQAKILNMNNTFASKHGRTIAVAASTALFAVLSTVAILSAGGYLFKQQSNQITNLNRVVRELKASNDGIVASLTSAPKKAVYAPANLEGSAFALNNKGYIVTSFHMVSGSDSIFIQNNQTERTSAQIIYCDPRLDLAVLKIDDEEVSKSWKVPFTIKDQATDIGEKVFTLGYPRKDMVYGEGSLSSLSGYSNDTSMYQISIPVNPGNSGGPLLDDNGNVIGVIRGKMSSAEATGFAIKANEILASIKESSSDTSLAALLTQNQRKNSLKNLKRSEQIKKINPYVFNVLVYKKD